MSTEVKVPVLPESVSDATIASWHKQAGEAVKRDENLVDLETDKVVLEVPSPVDGVLKEIRHHLQACVGSKRSLSYAGRNSSPAPATGHQKTHATEQAALVEQALVAPVGSDSSAE